MIRVLIVILILALIISVAMKASTMRVPGTPSTQAAWNTPETVAVATTTPIPPTVAPDGAMPSLAAPEIAMPISGEKTEESTGLRGVMLLAGLVGATCAALAVAIIAVARRRSQIGATGTFAVSLDTARTLRHTRTGISARGTVRTRRA